MKSSSKFKSRLKIVTSVFAFCGIIGIYVAISESLHDKTGPERSISGEITSNNATILASKETSKGLSHNPPARRGGSPQVILAQSPETQSLKTQALKTQSLKTQAGLARPALSDIRSLNVIDKLNSFDGSENENLRLAFALNEDYDFQPIQNKQDRKGNQHTRYQQTYRDVPVWGEQVLIHQGTVLKGAPRDYYSANGKVASGFEFSELDHQLANIDRSEDALREVIRAAKETNQHHSAQWSTRNAKSELVIYVDEQGQARPAYTVSYLAMPRAPVATAEIDALPLSDLPKTQGPLTPDQKKAMAANRLTALQQTQYPQTHHSKENHAPTRPHMLIDAASNQIIKQWEGLNTAEAHGPGGNEKTGRYEYGTDYPALGVRRTGDTCTLNNHKVKTVDLQHLYNNLSDKAHSFPCTGTYNENNHKEINGAYSPLNDAHFFGGLVFDMFQDWFYQAPLNFQLTMKVHYLQKYDNAIWTGSEMIFGDGFNLFYPLVDVNVSAHEVAHGFTEQNSGLFYFDQSGGINEAFSDIAGEAAEYYWKGEVDWTVGADIFIGEGSLRYFGDPTLDGVSIGHADDFEPYMDVHYSSGVYNRVFYLLANTTNWDVRKAFEVFVLANQFYWEPNETFVGGACGVLSAANDLGFEVRDVDAAFQTVGVNCGDVPFTDSDRDGMDNLWEMRFKLNPRNPNDAHSDADGDGLVNVAEYHERSNPQNADSDGDGINDLLELYVYKTNPNLSDSDYDGLSDYEERETWLTDPAIADTDADGMPDGWEVKFGLAPRNPDASNDLDGDGVPNLDEFTHQADPTLADTDGDGLDDYAEINAHLTAANLQDSDRDGLKDAEEIALGTDPTTRDSDNDYLNDGKEIELGTDPLNPDVDNDSITDGDEFSIWQTNPFDPDTDSDGLPDAWEVSFNWFSIVFDPRVADGHLDFDGDGLSNLLEYEFDSNPLNPDSDNDGLNDYVEIFESKTNPFNPDTDGDALPDSWEFQMGLDPLNLEDAHIDSDGDGWLNKQEFALDTHPLSAVEERDGLPAKPRVSDGASIAPDSTMTCYYGTLEDRFGALQRCLIDEVFAYGWWYEYEADANIALSFRSILPWTVTSAYLSFSASLSTSSSPVEDYLIVGLSLVDTDIPEEDTIFDEEAREYWGRIKNSPQFDSITIAAKTSDTPSASYTSTLLDLPNGNLNDLAIVIGKNVINLRKPAGMSEFVSDDDLSNRLIVTFAPDADEDGITDDWELLNGLDPTNPADALEDRDQDGASNFQEYLLRTNLDQSDSDGDGMPDGWEIRYGLDPLTDDSLLDVDNDGVFNLGEFLFQTSPLKSDSDGDGIDDATEIEMRLLAEYDETYQAPVCHSTQIQCRSGELLSGRGDVSSKPEINAPNTLFGACLDGGDEVAGTEPGGSEPGGMEAESTETEGTEMKGAANNWIESINIASTDLLELTVGKDAEISVTLNSSILFDNEHVDIFYTSKLEQTEWTLLHSFPLTAQATNEYAFPIEIPYSEQDKHAIRAIYRYGDSPVSCSQSTTVDHDDLVFTVHTEPNDSDQVPVVRWSGQTDTYGPVALSENTLLQAIAMDEQNIDRVLIELFDFSSRNPILVFSQSFLSPPYALNWSETRLQNGEYWASATATYRNGYIAVDELALSQLYKQTEPYPGGFFWPEISLDSPAEGATVKGEVEMVVSVYHEFGIAHVMVEVLGENEETFFSRTLSQDSDPSLPPDPSFNQGFVWDSSTIPAGPYIVRVTAFHAQSSRRYRINRNIQVEASELPAEPEPAEDEETTDVPTENLTNAMNR